MRMIVVIILILSVISVARMAFRHGDQLQHLASSIRVPSSTSPATEPRLPPSVSPDFKEAIDQLSSPDPQARAIAAERLGAMGAAAAPAVPFLIQSLGQHTNFDLGVPGTTADLKFLHTAQVEALLKIGEPAVEPLMAACENPNPFIRAFAVLILGRMKDSRAVTPLIARLKDGDVYIRGYAAWALGKLNGDRAVEPLIAALADGGEAQMRAELALGEMWNNPYAVEHLIAALRSDNASVRESAETVLEKIRWKADGLSGHPPIRLPGREVNAAGWETWWVSHKTTFQRKAKESFLQSDKPQVREAAISAVVSRHATEEAVKLIPLLNDKDVLVRRKAVSALKDLGATKYIPAIGALLLDKDVEVKRSAMDALAHLGAREYAPVIASHLKDPYHGVRLSALVALLRLDARGQSKKLLELLNDQNLDVRVTAAYALGRLGGAEYANEMAQLLTDSGQGHLYDGTPLIRAMTVQEVATQALKGWGIEPEQMKMLKQNQRTEIP